MSENGFDPKDVAEICSRKKNKFRMKKADFKELGRSILLGSIDVITGCAKTATFIAQTGASQKKNSEEDSKKRSENDFYYYYKD